PVGDDVEISLEERAEATILWAFATPDLLDLVALEREVQLARILNHVTGKRNSEIEVEPEGVGLWFLRILLQPSQQVDLLGCLPLGEQMLERFHRAGFDLRVAVQLEDAAQGGNDVAFDDPLVRQPFGET